jgi:hypothetical protein
VRISASVRYSADFQPAEHFESDDATLVLYHFDEGNGETAQDSSSYKRHGMIRGGECWIRPDWAVSWNKYQEFLRLLVAAREKAGLTQADLAEKIARSTDFVEQVEAGEVKIDVIEFVEIVKVLDMDPGVFLQELGRSS